MPGIWQHRFATASTPLVVGHRGAPLAEIENTVAAIDRAFTEGAHAVEVDVRAAACGTAVLSHDPDMARLGHADLAIAAHPLATLRAAYPGLTTLAAAAAACRTRAVLLDLKIPLTAALLAMVADCEVALGLRTPEECRAAKALAPHLPVLGLFKTRGLLAPFRDAGGDWVRFHEADVTPELLAHARQLGLAVVLVPRGFARDWGERDAAEIARLLACGPDALIVDAPALAARRIVALRKTPGPARA